ncbi:MAG: hypothetical protein ABJE95_26950, partial [Byssovorax sp.]
MIKPVPADRGAGGLAAGAAVAADGAALGRTRALATRGITGRETGTVADADAAEEGATGIDDADGTAVAALPSPRVDGAGAVLTGRGGATTAMSGPLPAHPFASTDPPT